MEGSNQHYLINMSDGRVILFTKQAVRQVNYHPISEAVALAIDRGEIDWQSVVSRIKANLINNQDAWDDLLKRKTTMNVRKSTLKPGDTEGAETAPDEEDVGDEFDMPKDGDGEPLAPPAPAPAPAARGKRRGRAERKEPEPPAEQAEQPEQPEAAAAGGDDLDV